MKRFLFGGVNLVCMVLLFMNMLNLRYVFCVFLIFRVVDNLSIGNDRKGGIVWI